MKSKGTFNIQHSTPKSEVGGHDIPRTWVFDVESWMLNVPKLSTLGFRRARIYP